MPGVIVRASATYEGRPDGELCRSDLDVSRLWSRISVQRGRAGVLSVARAAERAAAMPGVPGGAADQRGQRPHQGEARRRLLQLWQAEVGVDRAELRAPGLRAAPRAESGRTQW